MDIESLLAATASDPPCGRDLEYDADFLALEQAARGKPEQQFGDTLIAAEEPDWPDVRRRATELFSRTKDLRVAALLARALTRSEGFAGLLPALEVLHGLIERYWDSVHPLLDADEGNDPTMRMNALAPVVDGEALVRDLRAAAIVRSRAHGQVLVRDVEVALGRLEARAPGEPLSRAQVETIFAAAASEDPGFFARVTDTFAAARALSMLLNERVGAERAPDFKLLTGVLQALAQLAQAVAGVTAPAADDANPAATDAPTAGGAPRAASGEVNSRQDALLMIDRIITYLERNEPTSPAPLLLKRAQRLMTMNFVDIIKDMAPDSMDRIETITGITHEE